MLSSRFLSTYSTGSLKTMARRRGLVGAAAADKKRLISFLGPRLFSRKANRHLVQSLPGRQKQLLAALKARGGEADTLALAASVEGEAMEIARDIQDLVEMGLLLYPREGCAYKYRLGECGRVWMDQTTADAVDSLQATGVRPKLLASPPPVTRRGGLGLLLADLFLFLHHVENRAFRPPGPGEPQIGEWLDLSRSLLVPDGMDEATPLESSGRPYLLYLLLEERGLLKVRERRLVPAAAAAQFLHRDTSYQARQLFDSWQRLTGWNEFERIQEIAPRPLPGGGRETHQPSPGRVVRARRRVLATLRKFDPGPWYASSSLRREIKSTHPGFLVGRNGHGTALGTTYCGIGERGRHETCHALDLLSDWDRVEGRFIARILMEPLNWLGVVELGFEGPPRRGESRVDAFRITREGAFLLGLSDAFPDDKTGGSRLRVLPDFSILLLSRSPDTGLLHDLSRFSTFTGGDHVLRFTLSRSSVQAGFQQGWTRTRMIRRLEEATGEALPQNIAANFLEWERSFNRFRICHKVVLLEDPDGALAKRNGTAAAHIRQQLGEPISPSTWEIDIKRLPLLASDLERNGIAIQCFDYSARAGHAVELGPGLEITQHPRGEDWLTTSILSRVAVPDEEHAGRWKLSRSRVRAAFKDGLSALDLIQSLEERSPFPAPGIRLAIEAWAGRFQPTSVARLPLFTCEDRTLLSLILRTPALATYLGEQVAADTFVITPSGVQAFRQALRSHGLRAVSRKTLRTRPVKLARDVQRPAAEKSGQMLPFRWSRATGAVSVAGEVKAQEKLRFLLARAIETRRKIRLQYYEDHPRRAVRHQVSPLILDESTLSAFCHNARSQRTYRLARMIVVELLPERP
ncbi:MAG: WYL domain-containing protein [Acidobacteriota bacterium]